MSRNLSPKSRYAVILILLGPVALMEARHPFLSFRLATFILAFLALAGMASLLRGKLRDGLVVLASLAFGLSIADYTIDSNLLRETHSVETGPTIVFFGDSFTFGEGLNDADTLPQQFADLLGSKQRVLNLGYPGYGPQQFLAELQTGRFDGVIGEQPRLFIFMTGAGHAERTACKPFWVRRWPRYTLENGQVVLKGACYEGLSLGVREWLEDMASYRLFVEPYLQRVTHEDLELYVARGHKARQGEIERRNSHPL